MTERNIHAPQTMTEGLKYTNGDARRKRQKGKEIHEVLIPEIFPKINHRWQIVDPSITENNKNRKNTKNAQQPRKNHILTRKKSTTKRIH